MCAVASVALCDYNLFWNSKDVYLMAYVKSPPQGAVYVKYI